MADTPFRNYIKAEIQGQIHALEDKTFGHVLLNSRDVPKDANVGTSLNKEHSSFLQDIIGRLYYVTPPSGVASPGTVGKDHVIEEAFKKQTAYRQKLETAVEIPHSSAHGSRIHIDLGLRYIFRDAGQSVDKYLGPEAGALAFSSPTNLIDSANVNTRKMREDFFNSPVCVIASQETLRRFGFRLTKKITMYKLSLLDDRNTVVTDVSANLIEPIKGKLADAEFCITFDINTIERVGIPFGSRIFMLFNKNHEQIKIPEYFTSHAQIFSPHNIFNAGNEIKNKQLSKIWEKVKDVKERDNVILNFLKHFMIEVKLLGDANHCMFSRELIGAAAAAGGGGGGAAAAAAAGSVARIEDEGKLTGDNLAFGTNDYDVTLRFILEEVNVFYHKGVCTKYYTSKRMTSLERLIYVNEDTIRLIKHFRADLDKDTLRGFYTVIDGRPFRGTDHENTRRMYAVMKSYIDTLIGHYEGFLGQLRGGIISMNEREIVLQCTFKSPVITDPQENTALAWSLTRGFFDKVRFYSYIKGTFVDLDFSKITTYIGKCTAILADSQPALQSMRNEIQMMRSSIQRMREGLGQFLKNLEEKKNENGGVGGGGAPVAYGNQHGGGSLTDYSMSDFYPGLISYIVLTEYRDILKFGLAVYLSFGKPNTELLKFFYITQDEVTLHKLLEILGSGKSIDELDGEIKENKLVVVEEAAVEGGGAAAGGGGGGGAAAAEMREEEAAAAEKKKTILQNKYYDNLVFLACKYALHGAMYFRETYNTTFSQFNLMDLDSLVKIIVSLLNISDEYDTSSGGIEEGAGKTPSLSIFQSLRKNDILEDDLTESLQKHLNDSKHLFLDVNNSYKMILDYLNINGIMEIAGAVVTAAASAGGNSHVQRGGAYLTRTNRIGKTFDILNLQHSKVSELLDTFSYNEHLLTQMKQRQDINSIVSIYENCKMGDDDEVVAAAEEEAEAEAAAAEPAAAAAAAAAPAEPAAEAEAAPTMGEGEEIETEEEDGNYPYGGGSSSGGYPTVLKTTGLKRTRGHSASAVSTPSQSTAASTVSTPSHSTGVNEPKTKLGLTKQRSSVVGAPTPGASAAAGGGGGSATRGLQWPPFTGSTRRYDNTTTRKNRKQRNPTRKSKAKETIP